MQIPSSCFDCGAPKKLGLFLQRLVSGKEFWHLQNLKMCALKIIFDIWKTLLENAYHQVKVSQNLALKHSMMKLSQLSFVAKRFCLSP